MTEVMGRSKASVSNKVLSVLADTCTHPHFIGWTCSEQVCVCVCVLCLGVHYIIINIMLPFFSQNCIYACLIIVLCVFIYIYIYPKQVSLLKKRLKAQNAEKIGSSILGDGVAKAFLRANVALIGNYVNSLFSFCLDNNSAGIYLVCG